MNKIFILISFFLIANTGHAQSSIDDFVTNFFNKYSHNTDEAIDYLFSSNIWLGGKTDEIHKIKFQLNETKGLLGEYYGFEKLSEKSLGQSQKKIVYSVNYDRQPLRFILTFYKAKDQWKILNYYFDDNFKDEF